MLDGDERVGLSQLLGLVNRRRLRDRVACSEGSRIDLQFGTDFSELGPVVSAEP